MLNVSATQELAKRHLSLEEPLAALEAENARLRAQANKLAALESDMKTLKQLITVSHHKKSISSQTVALAHKRQPTVILLFVRCLCLNSTKVL